MPSPVRPTMADLLTTLRRYLGDAGGPSEQFHDDDLQDALDEHKLVVRYAPLRPGPTLTPGGLYDFLDYYASAQHWEANEVLTWVDFSVLTPVSADRISGHWVLPNTAPSGVYPPVRITGTCYDLWATAADLLEQWAALLSTTAYDFSADGQSFHRSQLVTAKLALAKQYRKKQLATSVQVRRSDLAGGVAPWTIASGGPGDIA